MFPSTFRDMFSQNFEPCECCKPKLVTSTCTTHKWTKKELELHLVELTLELSESKWYNRGRILDEVKHWAGKLKKYNEVESEFKIS